jgi:peptidoglycan/xylan/chitin deacetylase (PgdA/CDA1 family)
MQLISKKTKSIPSDYLGKLENNKLYSIITFDDAFENLINNAIPILKEYKLPFTIFFIADYFGKTPNWEFPESHTDKNERIMTIDQMNSLPKELLTIGSHTLNHKKLTHLDNDEINFELAESKRILEKLSSTKVNTISFPNGEFNESIVQKSLAAGYKRVFTIEPKFSLREKNEIVSGRVWVNGNDWYPEFWLKVHGGYCWLGTFFELKRKFFK